MSKSDKTRLALLLHYTGKTGDYGSSAARYARLWTVVPSVDGTGGTEVTGGAYAATSCAGSFPTATTGATSVATNAKVTFPTATANWATGSDRVVAVTISTASTGTTTFLVIQTLDNPVEVLSGTVFEFAIGALVLKET